MGPVFAVEEGVVAIVGAVAAIVGGGATWLLKALSDSRKTSLDEYKEIVDRLQKQVDRCQSQVDEQQRAINEMVQLHAECRAETQELYGLLRLQHNILMRQRDALLKLNVPAEEIPEMPQPPVRARDERVEYLRRHTQHNTDLAKQAQREASRENPSH